jgi:hypothetical protein
MEITHAIKKFVRALRRPVVTHRVDTQADAAEWAYRNEKYSVRLLLPVGMLRMVHCRLPYGPDHPFCQALAEGPEALSRFYERFQPQNLAEIYAPAMSGEKGAGLPPWALPWRSRKVCRPPSAEKGLGAEHGMQFWGPCSPQKVALEYQRLATTLASIKRRGYDPDGHSDIEGQLMTDGDRVVFIVLGGKHRAAVLAHMGQSHIPVRLRRGMTAMIDARNVGGWPLVANGMMSRDLALAVLDTYLAGEQM